MGNMKTALVIDDFFVPPYNGTINSGGEHYGEEEDQARSCTHTKESFLC